MNTLLTKVDARQNKYPHYSSKKTPVVAVVFPVYNPPNGWWKQSLLYCEHLAKVETQYRWAFHFVNDGSTRTGIFPNKNVLHTEGHNCSVFFHSYSENQGKGYAIRYGLQQVEDEAEIFMHCDWDFPFGTDLLLQALPILKHSDVVLADRGSEYLTHLPIFRQQLTKTQRFFNRNLLGLKATDTQAGFKAFNAVGKHIFLTTTINGFLFDTEFVKSSERNNLAINTLQANCRPSLHFKNFRLKVLAKEALSLITLIFK